MKFTDLLNIDRLTGGQRRTAEHNKNIYDAICDVSDVAEGYVYFQDFLFEKLIKIFKYENLPETIPAQALEDIILHRGKCGIVNTKKYGLVAVPLNKFGVGLYKRYEPKGTYTTPLVKGKGTIGEDIVLIRNNAYELGCNRNVNRYARLLADCESSLVIALANLRLPSIPSCANEESAESYKAMLYANRLGQIDAVMDKSFIQNLSMFNPATNTAEDVTKLITAREEILRLFLTEIGVSSANNKRERLTVDEVNSNSQLLLFNIRDMLDSRKEGIEEVNALFGTDIKVSLSDEYEMIKPEEMKGGVDNAEMSN